MDFEITLTLIILLTTIILFITEAFRLDITAILVMLTLGWTGLITPAEAFSGLSSNAVIAIIAIMIIGYGMEQSGVMQKISRPLLAVSGKEEKRLTVILSLAAGQEIIIMGEEADLHDFAKDYDLIPEEECVHCLNHRELEDGFSADRFNSSGNCYVKYRGGSVSG